MHLPSAKAVLREYWPEILTESAERSKLRTEKPRADIPLKQPLRLINKSRERRHLTKRPLFFDK